MREPGRQRDEYSLNIRAFRLAWVRDRRICIACNDLVDQRHQEEARQRAQEVARRAQLFVEFIDLSSRAFVDALQRTAIDPSQIMPLYATMGKLRLFASNRTVEAAEQVMQRIVETYYAPRFDLEKRPSMKNQISFASSLKSAAPSFAGKANM